LVKEVTLPPPSTGEAATGTLPRCRRCAPAGDAAVLPPPCAGGTTAVPLLFAGDNARAPGKMPRIRRRAPWTPPLCARLDTPAPQDSICVCRVRWRSGEHMETIR